MKIGLLVQPADFLFIKHSVFNVGDQCADIFNIACRSKAALRLLVNGGKHGCRTLLVRYKRKSAFANQPPIVLDHPGTDAVNGTELQPFAHPVPKNGTKTGCHIMRGSHRVSQRQNMFRRNTGTVNHIPQPGNQHRRLPASRHRQQKDRPLDGLNRFRLLLIQLNMKFSAKFPVCHLL